MTKARREHAGGVERLAAVLARMAQNAASELAEAVPPPPPPPRAKREPAPKPRGIEWHPACGWHVPSSLSAAELARTVPSDATLRRLRAAYAGAPVVLPPVRRVVRLQPRV